jgi:uncharacterized protein involved in exopolysaccharide biosynthesis
MSDYEPPGPYESVDLSQLGDVVWLHKWKVIAITAVFVAIALAYALLAKERFQAEVLLRPADTKTTPGISGALGGLGGLASLAGINISTSNTAEPVAVLASREFTASFITDLDLLPVLFPSKWDSVNKRWKVSARTPPPDVRDGVRYFDKTIRTVKEDKKTGFVTMTIEWSDPKVAANWANTLVDRLNDRMRNRALAEAETNVSYLKQELASSNLVALQQSIGHILETELQKLMLAKATKDYSFKFIDHAEPPKWRSWPRRVLIVGAGFILGLCVSLFYVIARHGRKRLGEAAMISREPRPSLANR